MSVWVVIDVLKYSMHEIQSNNKWKLNEFQYKLNSWEELYK